MGRNAGERAKAEHFKGAGPQSGLSLIGFVFSFTTSEMEADWIFVGLIQRSAKTL